MVDGKLNILILHALGDPESARSFLINHVFFLKKYLPFHNYLYHDVSLPLPEYAREFEYDAVILDVTFLCYRWAEPILFKRIKSEYSFISRLPSFKIALPQDEYDCHEVLDEWVSDLNVDVVYSVQDKHHDILYPRFHKKGEFRLGFTGYIDRDNIFPDSFIKPFEKRTIDVGYRSRKLPYYFGRLGMNKWEIADRFLAKANPTGFTCDISVREEDTLLGRKWYDFINDCKFTLGANSGSSLLDPQGQIQRNIRKYMLINPRATFEEVENLFFKGLDGRVELTAISPRIFEAGLLKSGLLLVKGEYSNIVKPWEHYIPLEPDCSNFEEVRNAMTDLSFTKKIIDSCYELFLDTKDLYYENHADQLIALISEGSRNKGVRSQQNFSSILDKYNHEMPCRYERLWRYKGKINKYTMFLKKYPRLRSLSKTFYNYLKSCLKVS